MAARLDDRPDPDSSLPEAKQRLAESDRIDLAYGASLGMAVYSLTSEAAHTVEDALAHFLVSACVARALPSLDRSVTVSEPVIINGETCESGRLHLRASENNVVVTGDTGGTVVISASGPSTFWRHESPLRTFSMGSLGRAAITTGDWMAEWRERAPYVDCDDAGAFADQLETAFDLLEHYTPEYFLWCTYLLREVVARKRVDVHTTTSASYRHGFGLVELCTPASVLETAEMLVHECSHLHFHLASWTSRLVQPDAPSVYSVLKNVARPLEMILLGFHDFGNVLLMYDRLARSDAPIDHGDLAGRMEHVCGLVRALHSGLVPNLEWLTPSGTCLYAPLAHRLVDSGHLESEQAVREKGIADIEVV
ncbi:HEXXH motif-containing putative peptide modification protein [uncultured Sphingomonas sp.]|uniref:aKG-HExxH-type peptide beta-hydroxylase n=1 Tax=uncultured Sphingomonas sp. TaxID=158754 RepID=UPI0035CB83F2